MNASPMILLAALTQPAPAQTDRDETFRLMRESAERYEVEVRTDDGDRTAVLEGKPLLRWTNPERRSPDGVVHLWTLEGRPTAALCVFPNHGALDHEWQSLAESPVEASYPEGVAWKPAVPGLTFEPVPDAPPVADSRRLRLSQMRALARRFTAWAYKLPRTQQVRLLPQPIYHYPEETPGAFDGAMFAYVQGTDPEVLLLLEARRDADGLRWYRAFARMSSVYLETRDGDQVVWSVEPDWPGDPSRPFVTFLQRVPIPASVAEDEKE